jgi:hypothetical protein
MVTKIDKAIAAFITAAGGTLAAKPLTGGSDDTTTIVTAVVIGLVAALGVWLVPNKA